MLEKAFEEGQSNTSILIKFELVYSTDNVYISFKAYLPYTWYFDYRGRYSQEAHFSLCLYYRGIIFNAALLSDNTNIVGIILK